MVHLHLVAGLANIQTLRGLKSTVHFSEARRQLTGFRLITNNERPVSHFFAGYRAFPLSSVFQPPNRRWNQQQDGARSRLLPGRLRGEDGVFGSCASGRSSSCAIREERGSGGTGGTREWQAVGRAKFHGCNL